MGAKRLSQQSRREFLKLAGASAVGASLAPGLLAETLEAPAIESIVGIANGPSIASAVSQAVEMAGGMGFIKPGQRVLIKPNQVANVPHPFTTNPEVLYEVAKLCAEAGSETIFISDRCFGPVSPEAAMKVSGHLEAAQQAELDIGGGVKVISVALDEAAEYMQNGSPTWRTVHHPLAKHYFDDGKDVGFDLAEFLFQVDHVINVPCCKIHNQAWLTMSLKAFVGMVDPKTTRTFFHSRMGKTSEPPEHRKNLLGGRYFTTLKDTTPVSRSIAELNLGFTPSLNIIDGTKPVIHGSHAYGGESVKADTIIASRDRVAADVAGVALIRAVGNEERWKNVSPWEHPMIIHAGELGLGVTAREHLTVKHQGVDNIETILEKMA
jgi:uncharacterized protein (DUF362 family)